MTEIGGSLSRMSPMRTSLVVLSVCLLSDTSGAGAGGSESQGDNVRNLTRKAGEAVKFHCDVHTGIYFLHLSTYLCLPGSGFILHFSDSLLMCFEQDPL